MFSSKELLRELKRIIKERGFSHHDLANELGVTSITITRLINGEDISIAKLSQICQLIQLDMSSLVTKHSFGEGHIRFKYLTKKQEQFLVDHPHFFHVFFFLVIKGHTPVMVQKRFNLKDVSIEKYLLRLDKEQIIKYISHNRIKHNFKRGFTFRPNGPLEETIKKNALQYLIDNFQEMKSPFELDVEDDESNEIDIVEEMAFALKKKIQPFGKIYGLSLKRKDYQKFFIEFKSLIEKYYVLTERTRMTAENQKDIENFSLLIHSKPGTWVKSIFPLPHDL